MYGMETCLTLLLPLPGLVEVVSRSPSRVELGKK
jgi:hypothetical protein